MNPTPADPLHVNHGDSAVAPPDFWRERRSQHPHFCAAVIADARCTMAYRGEAANFVLGAMLQPNDCAFS